MWAVVVALPAVQAEFNVARADASLPYTLAMLGFGGGAVLIGRLVDRFGIVVPVVGATLTLGLAFIASGLAPSLCWFAIANLLIGVGSSATLRAADRRHLALVHAPARHRGRRSARRATIWAARSGRRSCNASSRRRGGARPR